MAAYYPLFKTLHIFSVIIWFSGMLWLPLLFIIQLELESNPQAKERFGKLQRLLMLSIISPAMVSTLIFGICLVATNPAWLQNIWLHVKLLLVVGITGYHGFLAATRRRIEQGQSKLTVIQLKRLSLVPFAGLALIVGLVVFKPF